MENYQIISVDALVIGTGAAGYNAACRIKQLGIKSVAIVTEGVKMGTSRNTGSDKQTYYKLGLGGDSPDSVAQMAGDLFAGGAVDGDNALCEAALSSRCFLHLCELGVPFPCNRYGEYVGYKTDHDPFARATSAGPLTSRFMTEALEKHAAALEIPVYDGLYAVEILKDEAGVCGLLCLEKKTGNFVVFRCGSLVIATGGPAGIYADSVFPECHTGSSSLALLAGAEFQNLTEWQYGLSSVKPRWNVSGTYMQVLPRFVSIDENGTEREFLLDLFSDPYEALSMVFLKGYQWPFDSSKVMEGSSVIDLLVYEQTALLGRRVYLDYRKNPFGLETVEYEKLSPEAYAYLKKADACFGTPIQRLRHMNEPAIELYRSKGLALETEMLEIALCAQHNNGGIAVDLWWQTCVPGLFAAGECAGTHGISRPGGSALNAGQAGALRAAQYISYHGRTAPAEDSFREMADKAVQTHRQFVKTVSETPNNAAAQLQKIRRRMSIYGGAIREKEGMTKTLNGVDEDLKQMQIGTGRKDLAYQAYQYRDALLCQKMYLSAMLNYATIVCDTRGSALYYDPKGEKRQGLKECFRFVSCPKACADKIQQGRLEGERVCFIWRNVRPIPENNDFFETVWRTYRENANIF